MRHIYLAIMLLMFPIFGSATTLSYGYSPPIVSMDTNDTLHTDISQEVCAVSELEVDLSRVEIASGITGYGNGLEVNDYTGTAVAFRIEDPGRQST